MKNMTRYMMNICLLLMISAGAFAQQITVTGNVTDSQGDPLTGVSVTVKGTVTGTVTDLDGDFSLQAEKNAIVVFFYVGMQPLEKKADERPMKIVLQDALQNLNEVVVIGYGTQKKKDITTAVSTVTAKAIEDRPVIAAAQGLQGKAAGVQVVQTSGKPGGDITVRVRGNTSITASNEPLYVVDGVLMENITSVSPNDIESMQILKDASSAAIYGSRAANGVVLITTKKGKSGESKISFNMYAGFSQLGKAIEALNTKEYYDLIDAIKGEGYVDRSNHNYTNWYDEVFRTGIQQNYQLSLSGGNDKTTYYVSGGFQDETGIVEPAYYKRASFHANIDTRLKSRVKLSTVFDFSRTDRRDTPDNNGASRGGVILSVINTPPFLSVWDPNNPGKYQSNPFEPRENPVGAASVYDLNKDYWLTGNASLEFSILKGLTFKPSLSIMYQAHNWDYFLDPQKTDYGIQNNGIGKVDRTTNFDWVNENILTYDATFNEKHNLNVMGGFTLQEKTWDNTYLEKNDYIRGLPGDTPGSLAFANQVSSGSNGKKAESTMVSALARVHYNYDGKYLATANFRADASSKFAPGHRWGYFPSFSAGWRISAEPFFEGLTGVVNDLKLRAGWGQTGNQSGVGDYDYLARYPMSIQDPSNDKVADRNKPGVAYGINPTMQNVDLTWETTTQTNVGLDFSFLNSRIALTMDAYYKKTSDLLMTLKLPDGAGIQSPLRNCAEMTNKGFEFEIMSRNLQGTFGWDTELNMSFNKNKLTKIYNNVTTYTGFFETNGDNAVIIKQGLPVGSFFGFVSEGVDPETGNLIYKDVNENGRKSRPGDMDMGDRTVIGNPNPDFIYGMTNTMRYKGFTLSFFIQGTYGNDIFNASKIDTEGMTNTNNQSKNVLDRWQRPGMVTSIPKAASDGSTFNVRNSSRFIEDGSYLRLKTITLSYNIRKDLIRKLGLEALSVYATGNNLLTFTKYTGFDPEVNTNTTTDSQMPNFHVMGVDYGTYPQNRSCIFGLNLTF
ncbi:MAG: TonB-dependent receptor [Candidatus Azobacteroides sp.]|nr:TonB-dependent receptor [Candidatus Azobacteroides sp.]